MPPAVTGTPFQRRRRPAARAFRRYRLHDSAAGNHARANGTGRARRKSNSGAIFSKNAAIAGIADLSPRTRRAPNLNDANTGDDPGDISRRQPTVDKAMQLVRLGNLHAHILVLKSEEKLGALAETQRFRDS